MQEQLLKAVASSREAVDYLEIRVEQSESTAISFRGTQLDAVDRNFSLAGGIRACHKGGWSFVTFNNLAQLKDRIAEAVSQAHLVGKEKTQLSPLDPIQDYVSVALGRDPRGVSMTEKKQLMQEYNQMLLDFDPRIQTTMVSMRDRFGTTYFVNSTGTCIAQERLDVAARFGVIARTDSGVVRQGFESVHSRSDYDAITGIEDQVIGAAKRAV
ncbi:MAG: DNA gyrase modulator, partial [Coleofasciculaceae cyanobacterium]